MTVYTVALSKGGSTKTTTAAELVSALAAAGRRVLAVDLDQQGNLSTRLGWNVDSHPEADTFAVLTAKATALEAAVPSKSVPGAHVLVGTHELVTVDNRNAPGLVTGLRDHLPSVAQHFDDIVIDTPPSLDEITQAGLAAADIVVAAVACEIEALDQLDRLTGLVNVLGRRVRPGLDISWIVPTRYDRRRGHDQEIVDLLNENHPGKVTIPVREAVAVRDAYTLGMPVSIYDPSAPVTADYRAALAPVITPSTGA